MKGSIHSRLDFAIIVLNIFYDHFLFFNFLFLFYVHFTDKAIYNNNVHLPFNVEYY
jgi:hypothetical protein